MTELSPDTATTAPVVTGLRKGIAGRPLPAGPGGVPTMNLNDVLTGATVHRQGKKPAEALRIPGEALKDNSGFIPIPGMQGSVTVGKCPEDA